MYKYLVYVRRFAALLRREQSSRPRLHEHGSLPFHSDGNPWPPSRLTSILMKATSEAWQQKVNARLYRQIAIAITERHVLKVHLLFNRYDDQSMHADLNVVFAWQSGHRPLQRGMTYSLNGAFPSRLQPSLLRAYEWASTRWHEFIRQPSRELNLESHSPTPKATSGPRTGSRKRKADCAPGDESLSQRFATSKTVEGPGMEELLDDRIRKLTRSRGERARSTPARGGSSFIGQATITPRGAHHLTYVPDLQLLGCAVCATMVTRHRVRQHLRDSPHYLGSDEIEKVETWASKLAIICGNKEMDKIPLLPDDAPPIPVLGTPHVGGFRCTYSTDDNIAPTCRFVGSSLRTIREHLRQEHEWDSSLRADRRPAPAHSA
jgi:hypothetical protein